MLARIAQMNCQTVEHLKVRSRIPCRRALRLASLGTKSRAHPPIVAHVGSEYFVRRISLLAARGARHFFLIRLFIRFVRRQLHTGHGEVIEVSLARASNNLIPLLETPDFPVGNRVATAGSHLVLSEALWHRHFHADSHVAGRVVFLMGEKATIVGVATPDG
jgi:hypothetical protein